MGKKNIRALGIMSGTSLDGVDFVLAEINPLSLAPIFKDQQSFKFPKALQKRLIIAASDSATSWEVGQLHHDLGRFYASCGRRLSKKLRLGLDVIGLHGQTIFHKSGKSSFQIGEPSYLAALLEVPVVSDFRAMDLAVGGRGAPLATFFHRSLLGAQPKRFPVAFQNIGGIANVSYFDERGGRRNHLSFDTGPGNMLMDMAVRIANPRGVGYDQDGIIAAAGIPDSKILREMLKHPYFQKKPPKSCGREEFGETFYKKWQPRLKHLSVQDRLATLTEFTALSISKAYRGLSSLPKKIYVSGGGASNDHLLFRLRYHLPEAQILLSSDLGWDSQAIEGGAFAQLGAAALLKKSAHLPRTTGARRAVVLGKMTQA